MYPFTYSRAADPNAAVQALAGSPKAKLLGGGTNLVDLMKMGVETPNQLVDITRLDLAKIEELPDGKGVRIGALVRNSDLAEHPLIVERYPVLSQALLAGASGAVAQHGDDRRQFAPADAVLLFLRSGVPGVQQARTRQRVRGHRRLQPRVRRAGHQRKLYCDEPERHVRGDGRAGRRSARRGAEGRAGDSLRGVSPAARRPPGARHELAAGRDHHGGRSVRAAVGEELALPEGARPGERTRLRW